MLRRLLRKKRSPTAAFDGVLPRERQFQEVRDDDMYHDLLRSLADRHGVVRVRRDGTCEMAATQDKLGAGAGALACRFQRGRGQLTWNGAPVAEIAERAALSPGTVRNYLSSAVTKLGAENRHSAVRLARERGWV